MSKIMTRLTDQQIDSMRPHVGLHANRLKDDPCGFEAALAQRWAGERNTPALQAEFAPFDEMNDEDHTVVATVIQWVGASGGRSFLCEAFRLAGYSHYHNPKERNDVAKSDTNISAQVTDVMNAAAAMRRKPLATKRIKTMHPNVGAHAARLTNDPTKVFEIAFARRWAGSECHGVRHINEGISTLDELFSESQPIKTFSLSKTDREPLINLTDRHRAIIATTIQWMGTAPGLIFLSNAFNDAGYNFKIERLTPRARRRDMPSITSTSTAPAGP